MRMPSQIDWFTGSIKIELKGESMRKIQSPLTEGDQ